MVTSKNKKTQLKNSAKKPKTDDDISTQLEDLCRDSEIPKKTSKTTKQNYKNHN